MKKHASNLILLTCAVAFAVGLFQLFKLRFEAGDVYPPYSSLRSDPLGTMALFESLARMPGVTLVRDFNADNRLPAGRGTTYLHLAATREEWLWAPDELVQEVQGYVSAGGRLVIAFLPETSRAFTRTVPPVLPGKSPPKNPKPALKNPSDSPLFKDRWGVEFGFKSLPTGELGTYDPAQVENRTELPLANSLDWHSGMIFTNVNAAWTTVYSRGTNPVVIERKFGSGSVVLMTDSFCLSNQAMVEDRHPALLAWLIGSASLIEFDEAHLGLVESPGVASLIRKYRLHALVAGVLLVVGLFIWQHSVSFLPPLSVGQVQSEVAGKEAAAGFVNLLRRNIAPRDVLRVCFDEWTRSFARRGAHSIARVDQAQSVFEAEAARAKTDRDPVQAYREIRRALKGTEAGHATRHPSEINPKAIKPQ
jgi:uncharacterized protein DUF4350